MGAIVRSNVEMITAANAPQPWPPAWSGARAVSAGAA